MLLRHRRPTAAVFDALRAPIDWVVDHRNLTDRVADEPVIAWILQLAQGLRLLQDDAQQKVLLPFDASPWELALVRHHDNLAVSVYQTAWPWRVVADGVQIGLQDCVAATQRVLDELATTAHAIEGARARDALALRLADAGALLRQPTQPVQRRPRGPGRPAGERLVVETSGMCGLTITTMLEAARTHALAAYRGEHDTDRQMLLSLGRVSLHPEAGRSRDVGDRPCLVLLRWLHGLQQGLAGRRDPSGILLDEDDGHALRLHIAGVSATLGVWREGVLHWSWEGPTLDVLCLLCDHVADVVDRLIRFNPFLQTNLVLDDLRDQALELRAVAVRALGAPQHLTPMLAASPTAERPRRPRAPTAVEGWPVSLARAQRLRHEPAWSCTRPALLPGGVVRHGGDLLIATEASLERFDPRRGRPVWTRAHALTPGGPWVGEAHVLSTHGATLLVTDLATGAAGVTLPELGVCDAVELLREPDGVWILAQTSGRAMAIQPTTGAVLWSVPVGAPAVWRVGICVSHPVFVSARGDLVVLDPNTGDVVQRTRVQPGTPTLRGWRDGLLLVSRGERVAIGHLDARLRLQQRTLPLAIPGPIDVRADGRLAIAGVDRRGLVLWRLDTTAAFGDGDLDDAVVMPLDPRGIADVGLRRLPEAWVLVAADQIWCVPDSARSPSWTVTGDALDEVDLALAQSDHCPGLVTVSGLDGVHLLSVTDGRVVSRIGARWESLTWLGVDVRGDVVAFEKASRVRTVIHGLRAAGFLAPVD